MVNVLSFPSNFQKGKLPGLEFDNFTQRLFTLYSKFMPWFQPILHLLSWL